MRSIELERRRLDGLRSRLFGGRTSVQVVVGALAIAAIVLAFVFRPGQTSQEASKATAVPTKPTAAAVAAPPVATTAPVTVAVPTATTAPVPTKERIHTVEAGDTLSSLASKYYGDATKHAKIFDANKDVLRDPNSLQVGQKLRIPD